MQLNDWISSQNTSFPLQYCFPVGVPNLGGLDLGTLLTNPAIMDMVCLFSWLVHVLINFK